MSIESLNDAALDALGELHLHAASGGRWIGVVYLKGAKQIETHPLPCVDAVRQEVAKHVKSGLTIFVWAQDNGMILSES